MIVGNERGHGDRNGEGTRQTVRKGKVTSKSVAEKIFSKTPVRGTAQRKTNEAVRNAGSKAASLHSSATQSAMTKSNEVRAKSFYSTSSSNSLRNTLVGEKKEKAPQDVHGNDDSSSASKTRNEQSNSGTIDQTCRKTTRSSIASAVSTAPGAENKSKKNAENRKSASERRVAPRTFSVAKSSARSNAQRKSAAKKHQRTLLRVN